MALWTSHSRGENGLQLTTTEAGNTGFGGDPPDTVVTPNNTAAITYDDSTPNPITEGTVIRIAETTGAAYELRKTFTAVSKGAWQLVFRLRQLPSSITVVGSCRAASTGNIEMRLSSGNAVALNANGTTFDTASTALVVGDLYVWDVWWELGASTSTGKAKHRLRKINSDGTFTSIHTGTLFSDKNTGTANADSWRWGKTTSASTMGLDIVQRSADPGASDYCPDPITGICGSDQTQEPGNPAELHATGLGAWSQVSGPSVTLGGSGKIRTYTAPLVSEETECVFGFGGDTCTNTILECTDFIGEDPTITCIVGMLPDFEP